MTRIVLTGATGFIGSHLLRHLAGRHEVWALARAPPAGPAPAGARWVRADLAKPLDDAGLPEETDVVVHLAQSRGYRDFPAQARDIHAVNVTGTLELLEYARRAGAEAFVHASSGGVYGHSPEQLAESAPLRPLNFYLSCKHLGETLVANYGAFFRTVVLRPFFVYGPGQRGMLVPRLLEGVHAGREVVLEGDPGMRVNPVHVRDAVRVFEPAMRAPPGVVNVAGDEVVTLTELVHLMGQVAGQAPRIRHHGPQPAGDLVGDNRRMKQVLGVAPRVGLVEGLRSMLPPALEAPAVGA